MTRPVADACGGAPGLPPIISFDPGSAVAPHEGTIEADRLARWVSIGFKGGPILLEGSADIGELGYSPDLGLDRARFVKDWLIELRVDPHAIWTRGNTLTSPDQAEHDSRRDRSVMIDDPLRVLECRRDFVAENFVWFVQHCTNKRSRVPDHAVCDTVSVELSGRHLQRLRDAR